MVLIFYLEEPMSKVVGSTWISPNNKQCVEKSIWVNQLLAFLFIKNIQFWI